MASNNPTAQGQESGPRFEKKQSLRREFRETAPFGTGKMLVLAEQDKTLAAFTVGDDGDLYMLDELPDGSWETVPLKLSDAVQSRFTVQQMDAFVDRNGRLHLAVALQAGTRSLIYYMKEQKRMGSAWQLLNPSNYSSVWFDRAPSSDETVLYYSQPTMGQVCVFGYWKDLDKVPSFKKLDWVSWSPDTWGFHDHKATGIFGGKRVAFTSSLKADYSYHDLGVFSIEREGDDPTDRIIAKNEYTLGIPANDPKNKDYSALLVGDWGPYASWIQCWNLKFVRFGGSGQRVQAEISGFDERYHIQRRRNLVYCGKSPAPKDPKIGFEFFAYHFKSGELVHFTEDEETRGWSASPLVKVANADSYSVCRDLSGSPVIFAKLRDGRLVQMYRDDEGQWKTKDIVIHGTGQIREYQAYVSELTLLDEDGLPQPFTDVIVRSTVPNELIINNRALLADNQGITVQTDQRGRLRISDEVDGLSTYTTILTAPSLKLAYEFDPNVEVHETLQRVKTAEDVKGLKVKQTDGTEKPLISNFDPDNAKSAVDALNKIMPLTKRKEHLPTIHSTSHSSLGLSRITLDKAEDLQHDPELIHPASIADQNWAMRYDAATGRFTCRDLTEEEVVHHRESIRHHLLHSKATVLSTTRSWGDIFTSLWNNFTTSVEIVFNTVAEGLAVTIKGLWQGIVKAVSQAFDLVRWVFEKIGAGLEALWQWLGFVFNKKDILVVRDAVKHVVAQSFDVLDVILEQLGAVILKKAKTAKKDIKDAFDKLIADCAGKTASETAKTGQSKKDPKLSSDGPNNIFLQGLEQTFEESNSRLPRSVSSAGEGIIKSEPALHGVYDEITNFAKTLSDMKEFKDLSDHFAAIAKEHPSNFLKSALDGFLSLLSTLAQVLVGATAEILVRICNGARQVLSSIKAAIFAPLKTFTFLSELYKSFAESELTFADLTAMIIAIPASICYKAIYNKAMFADQAALDGFKSRISASEIKKDMRLDDTVATVATVATATVLEPWQPTEGDGKIGFAFGIIAGAVSTGLNIYSDTCDVTNDVEGQLKGPIPSICQFVLDVVAFFCTYVCTKKKDWIPMDWFLWAFGGLFILLDGVSLLNYKVTSNWNTLGCTVGCGLSIITLVLSGLDWAVRGTKLENAISTVVVLLPGIARPLKLTPRTAGPAFAVTSGIVIGADFVGYGATIFNLWWNRNWDQDKPTAR